MDEKSLIEQIKKGDKASYELLVKLHFRAVYSMVYRYLNDHSLTDDCVQEAFIKAYKALDSFRGESSFKSWVIRIGINQAKNVLRSTEKKNFVDIEDTNIMSHDRNFKNLEESQVAVMLADAVKKLPERQRQALELRMYEDLSFKEIADIMHCPFDTAKANFRHGLLNLRKFLEKIENAESFETFKNAFDELMQEDETYEA